MIWSLNSMNSVNFFLSQTEGNGTTFAVPNLYRKMVITIQIWSGSTIFRKYFSLCNCLDKKKHRKKNVKTSLLKKKTSSK